MSDEAHIPRWYRSWMNICRINTYKIQNDSWVYFCHPLWCVEINSLILVLHLWTPNRYWQKAESRNSLCTSAQIHWCTLQYSCGAARSSRQQTANMNILTKPGAKSRRFARKALKEFRNCKAQVLCVTHQEEEPLEARSLPRNVILEEAKVIENVPVQLAEVHQVECKFSNSSRSLQWRSDYPPELLAFWKMRQIPEREILRWETRTAQKFLVLGRDFCFSK